MLAAELSLARHGAQKLAGLAVPLLGELDAITARMPQGRAGTRIAGDSQTGALMRPEGLIGRTLAALTGLSLKPVRAILFDKNNAANWALGWHQDRTIAVRRRHDLPGYGPWTTKQGLQHVEPPFAVIERMTTVRLHLDAVDIDNAPLIVALGSHRCGPMSEPRIAEVVARCDPFACLARPGDVWVYSTPILHASQAAAPGRRRRVLQVDYTADTLPDGLEWLGI